MLSPALRLTALAVTSAAIAGALFSFGYLRPLPQETSQPAQDSARNETPSPSPEPFEPAPLKLTPPLPELKSKATLGPFQESSLTPPAPAREFRAAWIATVGNIDWPSKPGLSVEKQKSELIDLLDRAAALRLNAIVLQVRPSSDALYASTIEPWSIYLTGKMGEAPEPFYDPLAFAVEEAHKRGLELHAWFNPFRTLTTLQHKAGAAKNHISRTRPELVRTYGNQLWLDPGEPDARAYVLDVIADVVRRYDIDAVHLDDYFYPYRVKGRDFPDNASWKRYLDSGGTMVRDDWRRDNVNTFVRDLYTRIKAEKRWVKLGISPFGIWRPQKEPRITGLDAFSELYADSRTWLQNGWLDYISPQLYWNTDEPRRRYPVLLEWWSNANSLQRHLWPGIATVRIGKERPASDILKQIDLTRGALQSAGNIHWHFKSLLQNVGQISDSLSNTLYAEPALIPPFSWLGDEAPPKPAVTLSETGISWTTDGTAALRWALQLKHGDQWSLRILPGTATQMNFEPGELPEAVAITAVDRLGNASPASVFELTDRPQQASLESSLRPF